MSRRLTLTLIAIALTLGLGCHRSSDAISDAGSDGTARATFDPSVVLRAEDARRAKDIPPEVRTSHDVAARRLSARALARIADPSSLEGLIAHLADEDPETVAWAAYGLGYSCKGHEDAHVRLLAARAANLPSNAKAPPDARGAAELAPTIAIARAIGRCGTALAEQVLSALLSTSIGAESKTWLEPALLGLGDLATRKKQLEADTLTALLDLAGDKTPRDLAFYPLSRTDAPALFQKRVTDAARVAMGRASPERIFAIRALGRAGKDAPAETAAELTKVIVDKRGFGIGERAEAARSLGALGEKAQPSVASAIAELTPDAKDPIAIAELAGEQFHVLHTLLRALAPEAPRKVEPSLNVLASLTPPTQPKPGFARRLAEIRCTAAAALARGAYDAEILGKCDAKGSEPSDHAILGSVLRAKALTRDRLATFQRLAKSEHVRVREEAIEALGTHDIGESSAAILADALTSKHAGLVATAAETIHAHPNLALVLAASEKRAALDPRAPPPTANPAQERSPLVEKALTTALTTAWPIDRFETRIALFEAAASLRHPKAKEVLVTASSEPNQVVRERAQKALRTLGVSQEATLPDRPSNVDANVAPELAIGAPPLLSRPARVVFTTDALELSIILEPELSPVTATRLASLVKSGFYKGVVVHRVVPGFVAQLGDPEGDGYGGSGTPLRCETSPVEFHPLDVGMALAGRDTGSSQFFVTLARTPHLDGEYARVGRAEGDWAVVAEGDVITDARIVE